MKRFVELFLEVVEKVCIFRNKFRVGVFKNFIFEWEQLILDKIILDIVKGCYLEFENNIDFV